MYDSPITATPAVLPAKGVQKRVLGVESGISRWGGGEGGKGVAPPKAPGPFGASVPQKKNEKKKPLIGIGAFVQERMGMRRTFALPHCTDGV